ncbi:CHAT domain-containing protein [Gluconobacter kondonii]|uniref:CHAT domain-containing protein n=1 Tax=Gluconobacter kondonii TaxID=941463 RepID=UPI00209CB067|nr:CHAT domain-containing protein [Gluconobacter kondonii]MCP1237675.1 CHAT domain-containing protein [Gluconobacter kondonii]
MSTKPTVCLVESLGFLEEQSHREGEIISRVLQLSHKHSAYVYIKSIDELKAVAHEFGCSEHRYLHLSCHGWIDERKQIVGVALTTDYILNEKLVDLLSPHLQGRRLFLSSCLMARGNFATMLLKKSKCLSVLAPINEIAFGDAAVFWIAFYHLMFKAQPQSMSNARIRETVRICANLINEPFRLFCTNKENNSVNSFTIRPSQKAIPTVG